jgi:hypothetical protein
MTESVVACGPDVRRREQITSGVMEEQVRGLGDGDADLDGLAGQDEAVGIVVGHGDGGGLGVGRAGDREAKHECRVRSAH